MTMSNLKSLLSDVRVSWLLLLVLVSYFLVNPVVLPLSVSKETKAFYDVFGEIPSGSIIVLSGSYETKDPEAYYNQLAILNYLKDRDLRIILYSTLPATPVLIEESVKETNFYDNKEYGVEVVNLGYVPGLEASIRAFCDDTWNAVGRKDWFGTSLEDLPLMAEVHSIEDIHTWVHVSWGWGIQALLTQMQAPYGKPLMMTTLTNSFPAMNAFYIAGDLKGIIKGSRGAAELEALTKIPGPATALMTAQSAGHILFIIFVVISNIRYLTKRSGGKT